MRPRDVLPARETRLMQAATCPPRDEDGYVKADDIATANAQPYQPSQPEDFINPVDLGLRPASLHTSVPERLEVL